MVVQTPDGGVEFTFYRPQARQVSIAGDFNGWQNSFLMTRDKTGQWRSRLQLAPGIYQFRYRVDGQWYNDYAAFGLEHGPFGLNSVLKVDEKPSIQPQATLPEIREPINIEEPVSKPKRPVTRAAMLPSRPSAERCPIRDIRTRHRPARRPPEPVLQA